MDRHEKNDRFSWNLFFSLILLGFIPFLYTLVRTRLISAQPSTGGLEIAGHIEWFDLINETIQAFLIVPLYALFHRRQPGTRGFKERVFQTFFIINVVYLLFSAVVLLRCYQIVSAMVSAQVQEVTVYLRLETIGFILANMVSFANVLFVVLEKPSYFYAMTLLKTVLTIAGDLFLIPRFGVNGIAFSNIAVNAVSVLLCLAVVFREKLMAVSFRPDRQLLRDYLSIGLFSGSQILLDNLIYSVLVCRMVNAVAEQGNYWVANNIIWGLMLLPMTALAEIIKKDCGGDRGQLKMKTYHRVILVTFAGWLCFIPLLTPFLREVMGVENPEAIRRILLILIPFYLAYNYTVLFDNILIGYGRTNDLFAISVIVNLLYYPAVYFLVRKGVFAPSINFICVMFGGGMVVHLCFSVLIFSFRKKHLHAT